MIDPPDRIIGEVGGVTRRRVYVATGSPDQSVFPLDGFHFNPATDEVLVFANGTKLIASEYAFAGLETITLTTPILTEERLELVVLRGARFREEQVVGAGVLITLTGPNTYTPVLGDLLVFKDGLLLAPGPDYAETTTTTITLSVAAAGETYEIYGITGLLQRETVVAVNGDDLVDLIGHAYRPGSHDLLAFGDGAKFQTAFDYGEPNGEQVRLVEIYRASQTATAPTTGHPTSTFTDPAGAFESSDIQIGKAVLRITAVTGVLEIDSVVEAVPFEVPIASIAEDTELDIVGQFTDDPGDVTYEIRTPSFDGQFHTIIMRSFVTPQDVLRDLGEYRDLGRGGGDGFIDPDGNRPGTFPPGRFNPLLTVADLSENAEVIAARGTFDTLGERLDSLISGAGALITHGSKHVEGGADPTPNATPTVGGLHSGADKTAWDDHLGGRGLANHEIALPTPGDPAAAGFMDGSDKLKMDSILLETQFRGVWAVNFFSHYSTSPSPEFWPGIAKGGNTFYYLTQDGGAPEVNPAFDEPGSFTTRFTMFVDVLQDTEIFFCFLQIFNFTPGRIWVNGVQQALGGAESGGSARLQGFVNFSAGNNQRIDVGFIGFTFVGPIVGTRCSMNSNLLGNPDSIVWRSTPGL